MKVNPAMLAILMSVILCSYYPYVEPTSDYSPTLMTREQLESSVKSLPPQELKRPGKIYMKDHFVYIVEKHLGVHVVDNSDRVNPVKKKFIAIPGCVDIAIKGNSLYADNAIDLVAIDISDLDNVVVTQRIKETFPELYPPDYDYLPYEYEKSQRPDNTIIVAWERKN